MPHVTDDKPCTGPGPGRSGRTLVCVVCTVCVDVVYRVCGEAWAVDGAAL